MVDVKAPLFGLKGLNDCCDPSFYAQAYAQYAQSKAEAYATFINMSLSAAEYDGSESTIESFVEGLLVSNEWNRYAATGIGEYYYYIYDILVASYYSEQSDDLSLSAVPAYSPLDMSNPNGVNTPVAELLRQVNEDMVSCSASGSCILSGLKDSVSDRLADFDAQVSSISLTSETFSNTLTYFKSLLSSQLSVESIMGQLYSAMNHEELENDAAEVGPMNSDLGKYVGASPAGPLDFSTVGNAITSGVKVAAKVVGGIFAGIGSLLGGLFKKAVKYVEEVAINPFDIVFSSESGDMVCENFSFIAENPSIAVSYPFSNWRRGEEQIDVGSLLTQDPSVLSKAGSKLSSHDMVIYKTVVGTLVLTGLKGSTVTTNLRSDSYGIAVTPAEGKQIKLLFQPRLLNWNVVKTCSNWSQLQTHAVIGDLYRAKDNSEADCYKALYFSQYLMENYLSLAIFSPSQMEDFSLSEAISASDYAPSTVTNADFLFRVCGYTSGGYNLPNFMVSTTSYLGSNFASAMAMAMFSHYIEQIFFPLDYGFYPYSRAMEDFPIPGFRIKTDAENAEAFNRFGTTLVVAAVAIAAVVIVGVAAKKIATNLAFKREQTLATLNAKMWNGETLTASEKRAFKRATKKGGVSSLFSDAKQSASSNDDSGVILRAING